MKICCMILFAALILVAALVDTQAEAVRPFRGRQPASGSWNVNLNRYEYYDRRGSQLGYSRYNDTLGRTDYFNMRGESLGSARVSPTTGKVEYTPARRAR